MISFEKKKELDDIIQSLSIQEKDLEEKFILGSGKGGQKINKSHTCVQLKHIPTGVIVRTQRSRSREENRFFARRLLCMRLLDQQGVLSPFKKDKYRIKKQKKRRKRRQS